MTRNAQTYVLNAYLNPDGLIDVVRIYFVERNFLS